MIFVFPIIILSKKKRSFYWPLLYDVLVFQLKIETRYSIF